MIDGEDKDKMVGTLGTLFALILLVELTLAKIFDFSALLRWL